MSSIRRDLNLRDSHLRTINYRNLRRLDWFLLAVAAALAGFGLTALFSASQNASPDTKLLEIYYIRQGIAFLIGLGVALAIVCIDYRALIALAPGMYAVILALLVAVLFFGKTAKGGTHWLSLGVFNLQPSEASKLVLVYSLAWYLSLLKDRAHSVFYFIGAFAVGGGILVLILAQRDLGTALVIPPVILAMLYAAGCRKRFLLAIAAAGAVALPLVFLNVDKLPLDDYQKDRLRSFLRPEADKLGAGYQITQTKIAVGSGQMWGKGLGKGTQTQFKFLPEYHTDFIFALIAEEMG
ncbi:MAG: rod shape-determining protein RodA, partial [Candidatus Hydrogenedentes bacterium]|nr:rod shape-determining protein RodA [Candidatus Hydrogenedentota bacterium]